MTKNYCVFDPNVEHISNDYDTNFACNQTDIDFSSNVYRTCIEQISNIGDTNRYMILTDLTSQTDIESISHAHRTYIARTSNYIHMLPQ